MTVPELAFHEVDRERWPDLVQLFGSRGGPKSCWCMVWRATPQEAKRTERAGGATVVEAYPVDPESPSYRFMGFVGAFARAGFRKVGTAGKRRHVMRLDLPQ